MTARRLGGAVQCPQPRRPRSGPARPVGARPSTAPPGFRHGGDIDCSRAVSRSHRPRACTRGRCGMTPRRCRRRSPPLRAPEEPPPPSPSGDRTMARLMSRPSPRRVSRRSWRASSLDVQGRPGLPGPGSGARGSGAPLDALRHRGRRRPSERPGLCSPIMSTTRRLTGSGPASPTRCGFLTLSPRRLAPTSARAALGSSVMPAPRRRSTELTPCSS